MPQPMYFFCMRTIKTLAGPDLDFFRRVSQASFTNPFSQSRIEIDRGIADAAPSVSWDDAVEQAIARVSERLRALNVRSGADVGGLR